MMKILVLINTTMNSENALSYIVKLCQNLLSDYEVYFLSAYKVPKTTPDKIIEMNDKLKYQAQEALEKMKQKLCERVNISEDKVHLIAMIGSLEYAISHVLDEVDISLLVMEKSQEDGARTIHKMLDSSVKRCAFLAV